MSRCLPEKAWLGRNHGRGRDEAASLVPQGGVAWRVKRLHVIIAGTVQGVWFRESTRREAERLAVAGWVRNLPDGRVEAVFEGPALAVEAMVAWCHHGPANATVEHVEATVQEPTGASGEFKVLR